LSPNQTRQQLEKESYQDQQIKRLKQQINSSKMKAIVNQDMCESDIKYESTPREVSNAYSDKIN